MKNKSKIIIVSLYTPLLLISFVVWLYDTIIYRDIWPCIQCRADEKPSIKQQFLYFTIWGMFFTIVIFVCWAFFQGGSGNNSGYMSIKDSNNLASKIAQATFRIGLPHLCTVMLTYIYYISTNPPDGYINTDACFQLWRSGAPKSLTDGKRTFFIELFLVARLITDITLHFLSAPLLLYLLFVSKSFELDNLLPQSTMFMACLGVITGIWGNYGSRVYCGDIWFQVGMSILINFLFHVLFALNHRRKLSCKRRNTQENLKEQSIHSELKKEEKKENVCEC